MKTFLLTASFLVLALSSISAHATPNEFECENSFAGPRDPLVFVEVSRHPGASMATARVKIIPQSGDSRRFEFFSVYLRRSGGTRQLNYVASGFNLDIDLFPDARPVNLRDYRSSLRIREFNDGRYFDHLRCRFYL